MRKHMIQTDGLNNRVLSAVYLLLYTHVRNIYGG